MRRIVTAASLFLSLFSFNVAFADFSVDVYASPAPNFLGSPSWSGYAVNALNSLENELGDIGDRELDPTAYEIFHDGELVFPAELIVTGFNSWRGEADPAAPFASEKGNRLHFGLHIVGDGTEQFRMEDITYEVTSDDGGALDFSGSLAGSSYSTVRVGIDYGADRVKGGGDDTLITSGSSLQFVDEFMYVGVGNAYDATNADGATNQEKIDNAINSIGASSLFNIHGSYTLFDTGGTELATGSTFITVVPEPGGLLSLTLLGLLGVRRIRRREKLK